MSIAFDTTNRSPLFAPFCCLLDNRMTLLEQNDQLLALLGASNPAATADALTGYVHTVQIEELYQDIRNQLSVGDDVEFAFAIYGDQSRWLLGRAQRCSHPTTGEDCLQGMLVDFTNSKKKYDRRKSIADQYRLILDRTGDMIFEWDIRQDTAEFSEYWQEKFGYAPKTSGFSEELATGGRIHPEDLPYLFGQISVLRNSRNFVDAEIRIATSNDRWLWCKIRACGLYDADGTLSHIVGLIIDNDEEKKAHQTLVAQAEQDSLTHLLNAHTTRHLAEEYLRASTDHTYCAMLIIDLDDFKRINDQHGHLFGDEVLIRVANILKHAFRNDDIVGRIGGEEFLVLMKNISDPRKVLERCSHILESIRASSTRCKLTASIGVGIVSGDATRYEELFLRTDEALYQAKHSGKNQYILCK